MDIVERLRAHVNSRNGPSKDEDGNIVLPNGAWVMMLEAADEIERCYREIADLRNAHETMTGEIERLRARVQALEDFVRPLAVHYRYWASGAKSAARGYPTKDFASAADLVPEGV